MKIALCIPVYEKPATQFLASVLDMQAHTYEQLTGVTIQCRIRHNCKRIERARELLVIEALSGSPDWLLWLDADHQFPRDTLLRLLSHGLPFVGANYPQRLPAGIEPSARQFVRRMSGDKFVGVQPKPDGLEPVIVMGFGVALTKAEMFSRLPKPWFKWGHKGEDGYFCEQAIKHGYQPTVDHALSMEVGHIAETVLRFP